MSFTLLYMNFYRRGFGWMRGANQTKTASKRMRTNRLRFACTVRASASQGRVTLPQANYPRPVREWSGANLRFDANHREIALDDALCFEIACSNHLMVSPPLRGSNPYPCGSLTYRILHIYCMTAPGLCQPRGYEKIRRRAPGFSMKAWMWVMSPEKWRMTEKGCVRNAFAWE